jgi:hypothetical protein
MKSLSALLALAALAATSALAQMSQPMVDGDVREAHDRPDVVGNLGWVLINISLKLQFPPSGKSP